MSDVSHPRSLERQLQAILEGLQKEFSSVAEPMPVRFGGQMMSSVEMVAQIERANHAFEAVHRAQRSFREAVSNRRRSMKANRSLYEDAACFLRHYLGKDNPRLAQFGLAPPKVRRALTAEALAISRAKAAETRRLRGTLGKRQRLALGKPPEPTLQVFGADGQPLGTVPAEAAEPKST